MTIKNKLTERSLKSIEKITGSKLSLGNLLLAIRQADALTQIEFAKRLGITKQHLCDIEHNRKVVSPKLAAHYADLLGYSKEQFIRLSLQTIVDREGLDVTVRLQARTVKQTAGFSLNYI